MFFGRGDFSVKIGIISTVGGGFKWAGSEETWRLFATHVVEQKHSVAIQASESVSRFEKLKLLRDAGAQIVPRKELNGVTRRLANKGLHSRFRAFLKRDLDVLFLTMGGVADCLWIPDLLLALKSVSIPMVLNVQANAEGIVESETHREALRAIYRQASAVIFQSHHNHRLAERQLAMRIPKAKVISNPLREPLGDPLNWPTTGTFKFAEVARMQVNDKQQDHLLEALSDDRWKDRDWHLTLCGSGPDDQHVRSLVNMYGLEGRVDFIAYVENREDIWRDKHLHILPTRREGMPLALIESMACARPAIVTRAGGSPELIKDGENGFVCPGMHPVVLCETLDRAWQAREQWSEMGMVAYQTVREQIHEDWGQKILDVVVSVVRPVTPT